MRVKTPLLRGMAAVEVLIAMAILALCAIPIMNLIGGEQRQSAFNEFHMLGWSEGCRKAAILRSLDFEHLVALAQASTESAAGVPGIDDKRLRALPPLTPSLGKILTAEAAIDPTHAKLLEHAVGREGFFISQSYFGQIAPGLGLIAVRVTWRLPGKSGPRSQQSVYRRLIARPEISWRCDDTPLGP